MTLSENRSSVDVRQHGFEFFLRTEKNIESLSIRIGFVHLGVSDRYALTPSTSKVFPSHSFLLPPAEFPDSLRGISWRRARCSSRHDLYPIGVLSLGLAVQIHRL